MANIFSNPNVAGIIMVFSVPIVAIAGHYWHEVLKTRSNNELKQSMVERGMSAQEIEQIMNAGSKPGRKHVRTAEQPA